jgi:hypothetical protein
MMRMNSVNPGMMRMNSVNPAMDAMLFAFLDSLVGGGVAESKPQATQEEMLPCCCEQDDQVMISILAGLAKPGDCGHEIRKNIATAKAYAAAVKASVEQDAEDAKKALIEKQKEEEKKRIDEKMNARLKMAESNLAYFKDRLSKHEKEAAQSDTAIKLMGIPERPTTSIGIAIRQERSNLATAIEGCKSHVNRWDTEVGLLKAELAKIETANEKVC